MRVATAWAAAILSQAAARPSPPGRRLSGLVRAARFRPGPCAHELAVAQAFEAADPRLAAVLHAEEIFLRLAKGFGSAAAVVKEEGFAAPQVLQPKRQLDVAQVARGWPTY